MKKTTKKKAPEKPKASKSEIKEIKTPDKPQVKAPDMVKDTKIPEGYNNMPATGIPMKYTYKGYKKLIDRYWKENEDMKERNPAKYKAKKSELETKLGLLK